MLNKLTYSKCPPRIQRGLDRRRISATVLLAENLGAGDAGDEIRRQVFERLNTGGLSLNAQELRNSLYSGPFNDLINELAGLRLFNKVWDIPPYVDHYRREDNFISSELAENKLFSRMQDCEIVLRFFAFRRHSQIKGSVRRILDQCMHEYRDADEAKLYAFRQSFVDALELAHKLFQDKTFRLRVKEHGKWTLSQPLYDAVMVALDDLKSETERLIAARGKIQNAMTAAYQNERNYDIIIGKPNTANAIKDRIDLVRKVIRDCI